MSIRVRRFEPADEAGIERLNARLQRGDTTDRVYAESPTTPSLSRGDAMSQELYVAADGDEVRGGVWLHEHEFLHHGRSLQAGWLKYPVSESLINREYGGVPGAMILTMMRRQPYLMALGMGGRETPFARLLASIGWRIEDVPFFAALVRPARVVKHAPQMRGAGTVARAARLGARLGLLTAGLAPLNVLRSVRSKQLLREVTTSIVSRFDTWADDIWNLAASDYGFIARRDAAMLNLLYPSSFPRLTRLQVTRDGRVLGWVCTTLADPGSSAAFSEFGELRVGMIADGTGQSQHAAAILAAGVHHLVQSGADLIVTNQMHPAWRRPLRWLGFLPRPTNFLFACSKRMAGAIGEDIASQAMFINRGDCDGPPRWW